MSKTKNNITAWMIFINIIQCFFKSNHRQHARLYRRKVLQTTLETVVGKISPFIIFVKVEPDNFARIRFCKSFDITNQMLQAPITPTAMLKLKNLIKFSLR
ncbi:hypothetical protein CES87_02905 [Pseudomonas sp. ERMR1:02]|nr:hypothetical protein CES87_02905 [Pseudomonas sp. ERMR1:02]